MSTSARTCLLLVVIRGISAAPEEPASKFKEAPWNGKDVNDLHAEYYNIFKHGNRNAASHLWSKFLLDRADQMTPERFTYMFTGFCAVSGSPVSPRDGNRWRYNLTAVGGGKRLGYMHHCCWPCVCDTQDFIRVDTKTVTLLNGVVRQYHFAVLGNPCDRPEELTKPWVSPFGGGQTTIAQDAAEVRCDASGHLEGAYLSDHGNIIIGMFQDENQGKEFQDEKLVANSCKQRADAGYNSGMGEIFRKVAAITPVKSVLLLDAKASMTPLKSAADPKASAKSAADPKASVTTVKKVKITFTFKDLSFTKVTAEVKVAMAVTVQENTLASLPTGYKKDHVEVVLKAGSVIAEVSVTPLAGSTAAALTSKIDTTVQTAMEAAVVAGIKAVPKITSALADGKTLADLTISSTAPLESAADPKGAEPKGEELASTSSASRISGHTASSASRQALAAAGIIVLVLATLQQPVL